jgi:hypothetical protein
VSETTERRYAGLTHFIGVKDVMQLVHDCCESQAYLYLREAAGRLPGERGQLRVTKEVWEQYVLRKFRMSASTRTRVEPPASLASGGSRSSPDKLDAKAPSSGSTTALRVTQPRFKAPEDE